MNGIQVLFYEAYIIHSSSACFKNAVIMNISLIHKLTESQAPRVNILRSVLSVDIIDFNINNTHIYLYFSTQ